MGQTASSNSGAGGAGVGASGSAASGGSNGAPSASSSSSHVSNAGVGQTRVVGASLSSPAPPSLDLTEVYPRILISGLPYNAVTSVGSHRNNATQLAAHLDEQYRPYNYLIFNLAPEERVTYDPLKFHGQVVRFPPVLSDADCNYDDGLPTVAQTFQICYALAFWLNWNADNVAILHDISGRTRSAFVVACFLGWTLPREWTVPGAFAHIQGLRGSRFSIPTSWYQQLNAFQLCVQQPRALRPRKLRLMKLMASMSGGLRPVEKMASKPIIKVFENNLCVWDSEIDIEVVVDDEDEDDVDGVDDEGHEAAGEDAGDDDDSGIGRRSSSKRVRSGGAGSSSSQFVWDEGELKATVERYVQGDVQLFIFAETIQYRQMHLFPTPSGEMPDVSGLGGNPDEAMEERRIRSCIVRYAFHTNMVGDGPIITTQLSAGHVDLPNKDMVDKDQFKLMLVLHEEEEDRLQNEADNGGSNDEEEAVEEEEQEVLEEVADAAGKQSATAAAASEASSSAALVEYEGTPPADDPLAQLPTPATPTIDTSAAALGSTEPTTALVKKVVRRTVRQKKRRRPRERPDDVLLLAKGNLDWTFAECLNLRGRRSFLAGLFYTSEAHHVFPEQAGLTMLLSAAAPFAPFTGETHFFIVALQIAERNVERACRLLRSDFMLALMDCTRPRTAGVPQRLGDAELGSGGYKRLFERPWLADDEDEGADGEAQDGDAGEGQDGSSASGGGLQRIRKRKSKKRYPRRAGTRPQAAAGAAAGGDGAPQGDAPAGGVSDGPQEQNDHYYDDDDDDEEEDLDDEPFGAFNIQEKARERAMMAPTRRASSNNLSAASSSAATGASAAALNKSKRVSTVSIGGGKIVLGEDDEDEDDDDDDDDESGAAAATEGKIARRHHQGAVRRGSTGSGGVVGATAASAMLGLEAAGEQRKQRRAKRRAADNGAIGVESGSLSFADDLTRHQLKATKSQRSARRRERALLRAAAAKGDRSTGLVFLGDPNVDEDAGSFGEGSSLDDLDDDDEGYSDEDDDDDEDDEGTGDSALSVRNQDRWEKQKRAVLAGPIAQLMIPVISTALADLAHKAEQAAASSSASSSGTPAAVPSDADAKAAADRDAETQIALHEGAHSFLVKSVSALQSVANEVGAAAANVAAAAVSSDADAPDSARSADSALSDHPLADAVREQQDKERNRSRSGTAVSTRSVTLNDLPSSGRKQAQSIASVQVELTSKTEPVLYAAALHIATAVLHAERSEITNAAFQAAQIADTTGDTEQAISTRSRLVQEAINGFSRLDVHAMGLLLESVRIIVSGGQLKPILPNTPELALEKPVSPAADADGEQQRLEEEERRHHLVARASSLITSLLTQNPHLQTMHAALALQLEGDMTKGTAAAAGGSADTSGADVARTPEQKRGRASSIGAALSSAVTSSFAFGAALDLKARLQATASSALRSLLTPPTPPPAQSSAAATGTPPRSGSSTPGDKRPSVVGTPGMSGGRRSRAGSAYPSATGAAGAGDADLQVPFAGVAAGPTLSASALKALGMNEEQTRLVMDLLHKQQLQQQQSMLAPAAGAAAGAGAGGNEASAVALLLPLLASLAAKATENTAPAPAPAPAEAVVPKKEEAETKAPPAAASAGGGMSALLAGIKARKPAEDDSAEGKKQDGETAAAAPPAAEAVADEALSKYAKMLKMGIPEPAVRLKMKSEGIADSELDAAMEKVKKIKEGKPAAATPAPEAPAAEAATTPAAFVPSTPEEEALAKYAKMLKMGIPEPAVRLKMKGEGLIPEADLDSAFEKVKRIREGKSPVADASPAAGAGDAGSGGVDISKYEKMLKMGIPPSAAQHKMKADGAATPEACKAFIEACKRLGKPTDGLDDGSSAASAATPGEDAAAAEWKRKKAEKEEAAKASKASEAAPAMDRAAAEAKALEEARLSRIADLLQQQLVMLEEKDKPVSQTETYGKYFKMRRMGVPDAVIEHKLTTAGLDPAVLKQDESLPLQSPSALVPLKEDAKYSKFFRMLKVGLAKDVVTHKMAAEGCNALALELNPDLPAPAGLSDLTSGLVLSPTAKQEIAAKHGDGAAGGSKAVAPAQPAKPKRQRKKLHWEALPESRISSKDTIWGAAVASAAAGGAGSELIDDDELQALFTQDVVTTTTTTAGKKGAAGGKQQAQAQSIVYLIDMKRGRNVGIGVKRLKMPPDLLRKCLLNLTRFATAPSAVPGEPPVSYTLSQEDLILVEELLPTPEEVATVRAYRGDKARLGEAERFFLAVADVQKPKQRAQALSFQCVFDASDKSLTEQIAAVQKACEQTRTSARLRKVLEATLLLGNKLNAAEDDGGDGGSAASRASDGASGGSKSGVTIKVKGFSVSSLLKLSQTKAYTSSKMTLLHYLATRLRKIDPSVMELSDELSAMPVAARLTLEMLRNDLTTMKGGMSTVEKLVREQVRHEAALMHRGRAGSVVTTAAGVSGNTAPSSPSSPNFKMTTSRARAGSSVLTSPAAMSARASYTVGGETSAGFSAAGAAGAGAGGAGGHARLISRSSYLEDVTGVLAAEIDAAIEAATSPSAGTATSVTATGSETSATPAPPQAEALPDFVARAQARVASLQSELDAATSAFSGLLEFFGEEATSMTVEAFFTTLNSFVMAFQRADAENLEDEKKKQREAARKSREISTPSKASPSPMSGNVPLTRTASSTASAPGQQAPLTPLHVTSSSSSASSTSLAGGSASESGEAGTAPPALAASTPVASSSSGLSSADGVSEAADNSSLSPAFTSMPAHPLRTASLGSVGSVGTPGSTAGGAAGGGASPFTAVLGAIASRKGGIADRGGLGVLSPALAAAPPAVTAGVSQTPAPPVLIPADEASSSSRPPSTPTAATTTAPATPSATATASGPPTRRSIGLSSLLGGAGGASTFNDRQNMLMAAIKNRQQLSESSSGTSSGSGSGSAGSKSNE